MAASLMFRCRSTISPLFRCQQSICNSQRVNRACFSTSFAMRAMDFDAAQARVTELKERPDNTAMLQLYGLFKQATTGKCDAPKPGMTEFVKKAKWNAWNSLGSISQDDAKLKYVELVESLMRAEGGSVDPAPAAAAAAPAAGGAKMNFEQAQARATQLNDRPENDVMLKLYGLFKQATSGQCETEKPGYTEFVKKAKWKAWNSLGDISQDAAKSAYIELVEGLVLAEGGSITVDAAPEAPAAQADAGKYKNIVVTLADNVHTILLNRPKKKNALTPEAYNEIAAALKEIGEDKNSAICVITGAGDFYSSGNDLSTFASVDPANIAQMAKDGRYLLLGFVNAFIDFPKPLVAVVNGPAVGVAVTTLSLCDVVYATDRATLQTPMVALGQSPEGCSAYMFTKLMGQQRANEMLMFSKKISARQACDWGLVTEVFNDATFHQDIKAKIAQLSTMPKQSLRLTKQLMRDMDRAALKACNEKECQILEERWQSEECFKAIMDFFTKKSKL